MYSAHFVCAIAIMLGNFQGAAYKIATKGTRSKGDLELQVMDWMNNSIDVNLLGVRVVGDHLEKQIKTGWLENATNIASSSNDKPAQ